MHLVKHTIELTAKNEEPGKPTPDTAAIEQTVPRVYVPVKYGKGSIRETFIGQWPGDETEEQILDALREGRA